MADVFGAEVCQFETGNSACLGAALRAVHADAIANGSERGWEEIVAPVVEPLIIRRLQPDRGRTEMYRDLLSTYATCEADARGCGRPVKPVE
jgi:sugar (pentulose or hexulose) kinase